MYFFPLCFSTWSFESTVHLSVHVTCYIYLILIHFITLITFDEKYKLWSISLCNFLLPLQLLSWILNTLLVKSYLFASNMLQDSHKTRTKILGNIDPSKVPQSTVVVDPLEHRVRLRGKVSNTSCYARYRHYKNMTLMCQTLTSANVRNEFTEPESKLWNNLPPIINTLPRYNSI